MSLFLVHFLEEAWIESACSTKFFLVLHKNIRILILKVAQYIILFESLKYILYDVIFNIVNDMLSKSTGKKTCSVTFRLKTEDEIPKNKSSKTYLPQRGVLP